MPDEAKLIEQATGGSVESFSELVALHQGRVRAYIGRFVRNPDIVDDLAQEVFIAAYKTLNTYNGDAPLGIWLIGIARNRALTYIRDESRRRARESGKFETAMAEWRVEDVERHSDAETCDQELSAMESCIKNLPENSARLIREHYFNSRSSVELASSLGKKESSIRMTLLRIRQSLRDCIETRLSCKGA